MTRTERERLHQARLEQAETVQVVCGKGDRARADHEATLLERARLYEEEICAHAATERGLEAFGRLLRRIEEQPAGRTRDLRAFLDAVWNGKPLALRLLRATDAATGDDMLAVLDAYRYGRFDLVDNVDGGARRVMKALGRSGELARA